MAPIQVYEHPRSTWPTLIQRLTPLLPVPFPLLRRLQHHHKPLTLHVHATFPPLEPSSPLPPHPYAIISIDRHDTGITSHAFSSLELDTPQTQSQPDQPTNNITNEVDPDPKPTPLAIRQYVALLAHVANYPPPPTRPYIQGTSIDDDAGIIMLGAAHHAIAHHLFALPGLTILHAGGHFGGPYNKYVRDTSANANSSGDALLFPERLAREEQDLPPGLAWSTVSDEDHGLVMATNAIVRHPSRLAHLRNMAIVADPASGNEKREMVAWAFIGLDGALRTLYTVPEWRGRGLAGKLCRRLWAEQVRKGGLADAWVHCDAAPGNRESIAVLEKMGLWCGWVAWWLRIDINVAGRLVEEWRKDEQACA